MPIQISSLPPESGGAYFTVCIAYGEGVVLIIDVVRANKFLQDEIGIGTAPAQQTGKGWMARQTIILLSSSRGGFLRASGSIQQSL